MFGFRPIDLCISEYLFEQKFLVARLHRSLGEDFEFTRIRRLLIYTTLLTLN